MRSFEASQDIQASIEAAWSCMVAVEAWPAWLPTVRSVEPLQDGPLAVGSRYRLRQPRLPSAVWRVTELEPGRSFAWESRSPGSVGVGEHCLTARGPDACTAHLRLTLDGPLSGVVAWLGGRRIGDYVATEARSLREIAELRSNALCAYCGQRIRASAIEPMRIAIELPDGGRQALHSHVDCMGKALHPGTLWLSKSDWERPNS